MKNAIFIMKTILLILKNKIIKIHIFCSSETDLTNDVQIIHWIMCMNKEIIKYQFTPKLSFID
jgi:hypothetical protein